MLKLKVLDGKFNKDADTFSKMDPFARINLDGRCHETKVCKNSGVNPVWDQQYEYNAKDLAEMMLKIQAYDKDPIKDDLIGQGQVCIKPWLEHPNVMRNQNIPLTVKGQESGSIRIQYFYNPSIIPQTKTGFLL